MLFKLSVLIDMNIETHSDDNIVLRIVSYEIQDGLMYISLSKIVSSFSRFLVFTYLFPWQIISEIHFLELIDHTMYYTMLLQLLTHIPLKVTRELC